jgi:predicted  nucleic acid-binding Zn-ribbon protein
MGKKEEYQAKIEAQLKKWGAELEELKAKAAKASQDVKAELNKQIETLKARQDAAQKKFKELKAASGEAWQDVKASLEKTVAELKEAWSGVLSRFRKKGG